MSGIEIERKFLVKHGRAYRDEAFASSHICQGYIPAQGATVRIRVRDDKAFLTIKSHTFSTGLGRYEFEHEISLDEARQLLKLCEGGVIDKHRYLVKAGSHVWEVDEFHGANDGLVMAEVELGSDDESFEKPHFIGPEVTGDRHFYNSHMLTNPYSSWRMLVPEEYR